ncbi:MAG: hypothetical protein ACKOX6_11175 [Bdellovibrio sp.]
MNSELQQQLRNLALKRTIPFCYSCYQQAPTGVCKSCHSDDLMRLLPGHGCEYGLDWAIAAILREELTPVDTEEAFQESVRSCYPEEVQVGWMSFDAVTVMKEMDPISWDLAMSEWLDQKVQEENLVPSGGKYFSRADVEALIR